MKKIIVFNHKMSLLYDDLYNYIERTNNLETDNDIIICPSDIYLEAFVNNSDWLIGSQNLNYNTDYKHTGEISTDQLKSLGVEYSIIGHYERVRDFNENAVIINNKLIAALDANIFPILCFGENIDDDYHEAIPIFAIGTGALPSRKRIEEVISFVNEYLEDKYKKKPNLLYGGSVDSSNINDIINIEGITGVLVGDISSNIKEVERIIQSV